MAVLESAVGKFWILDFHWEVWNPPIDSRRQTQKKMQRYGKILQHKAFKDSMSLSMQHRKNHPNTLWIASQEKNHLV